MASLYWIGLFSSGVITAITSLGAISRFTHGRFTPGFYAYQLDRAPDDASTRLVPYMDVVLATTTVYSKTRPYALLTYSFFQAFGIKLRLAEKKDPTPDFIFLAIAIIGSWSTFAGW